MDSSTKAERDALSLLAAAAPKEVKVFASTDRTLQPMGSHVKKNSSHRICKESKTCQIKQKCTGANPFCDILTTHSSQPLSAQKASHAPENEASHNAGSLTKRKRKILALGGWAQEAVMAAGHDRVTANLPVHWRSRFSICFLYMVPTAGYGNCERQSTTNWC